jgi:hypothetical protein
MQGHRAPLAVATPLGWVGAAARPQVAEATLPATLAALIAFPVTYVATDLLSLPRLFYLPLEDRFVLARHPQGLAMGYLGLCLWAALAALVVFAVVRVSAGRISVPMLGRAALCAFAVAVSVFAWLDWPWAS